MQSEDPQHLTGKEKQESRRRRAARVAANAFIVCSCGVRFKRGTIGQETHAKHFPHLCRKRAVW